MSVLDHFPQLDSFLSQLKQKASPEVTFFNVCFHRRLLWNSSFYYLHQLTTWINFQFCNNGLKHDFTEVPWMKGTMMMKDWLLFPWCLLHDERIQNWEICCHVDGSLQINEWFPIKINFYIHIPLTSTSIKT